MPTQNKDTVSELLEAHVKFELARFKGAKLRKFARQEVHELFGQMEELTLRDISSVDRVMEAFHRIVVDAGVGSHASALLNEIASGILYTPELLETRLKDVVTRDQALAFLEQALELQRQREKMIRKVMDNPVYQEMIADLVYSGLMNYLYEDNAVTKSVPAIGSMMKFGKRMANRASPGLDERIERGIKSWLSESLPILIGRSESFLNEALSSEELRDAVMRAWDDLEDRTLAELWQGSGGLELGELSAMGGDFWAHFRTTDYFQGCCRAAVEQLFHAYGDVTLARLLDELGVTEAVVTTEVEANLLPIADVLHDQGYLEALLRRRLEPFYRSAPVKRILQPRND
jgi:siroheme synthase (precorrin-2 oxidase/ferrochelatase)